MEQERLKCPWPYFGGKSKVADLVWSRLGAVSNYVEPFCGSAAVLLARPRPFDGVETVNDMNAYVTNAWRAIRFDPEGVVEWCDAPVNELDLHANHRWLVLSADAVAFRERLRADPEYFDVKVAGRWIHGACCWIGGGWCEYREGPASSQMPDLSSGGCGDAAPALPAEKDLAAKVRIAAHNGPGKGVNARGDDGAAGLAAKVPRLTNDAALLAGPHQELRESMPRLAGHERQPGQGVCNDNTVRAQGRPQLADAYDVGRGVHAGHEEPHQKRPIMDTGRGDDPAPGVTAGTCDARRAWLLSWFRRLQDRLRLVRVCAGHWLRVCDSPSVTTRLGTTGLFLDPPYPLRSKSGKKSRAGGLYQGDEAQALDALRDEVLAYCLERGGDRQMRIALACYEGDGYEALEAEGWEVVQWQASGGYANQKGKKADNAARERLYFSPHCDREAGLFDHLEKPR